MRLPAFRLLFICSPGERSEIRDTDGAQWNQQNSDAKRAARTITLIRPRFHAGLSGE